MVERYNSFVDVVDVPLRLVSSEIRFDRTPYHLSHFIEGFPMSPLSIFGSDPPERAIVNLPFLSIASCCALPTNAARPITRSSAVGKGMRMGALGGGCAMVSVGESDKSIIHLLSLKDKCVTSRDYFTLH